MYINNAEAYISVIYLNYFVPGSLRLWTNVYQELPENIQDLIELTLNHQQLQSRRWLQQTEAPYPGYCRGPGSNTCLPLLCNCKKLLEAWNKFNKIKATLKEKNNKNTQF